MIDLHVHSTASDGSVPPLEIIEKALSIPGLQAISITDHDTIEGVRQVIETGLPPSLEFITGIEISADPLENINSTGSFHILGYGISIHDTTLNHTLKKLKQARIERNPRIIEKLNLLGCPLTLEEVRDGCTGTGQMGRPHIASAMVKKGFVSSLQEAFDKYLAAQKPAYVDKFRLSCRDAIDLIRDAGGIPVLAHPFLIQPGSSEQLPEIIDQLVAMGLKGIEVYYTDNTTPETEFLEQLAREKKLLVTGGSDFHGTLKKGTEIGTGKGSLYVDYVHFQRLVRELEKQKAVDLTREKLEKNISYTFKDENLLQTALCHSSYSNEHPNEIIHDNQRLEFLGDAVLGLCIGQILMEKFPDIKEGDLSKLRAGLVSETGLMEMAKKIDLSRFILLGKGELLSKGNEKKSILADTYEALMAAVYLDSDFTTVYHFIETHFHEKITCAFKEGFQNADYKSLLQEHIQEMGKEGPTYTIVRENGPDHDKTFDIELTFAQFKASGTGKSKKTAEQDAARRALENLKLDHQVF
ncbi:MAG: ribonuclease III [Thermodesulfobacteriota bacterium]|nr:ribonuclease III [Thermodesulfobacteriota bacterium]